MRHLVWVWLDESTTIRSSSHVFPNKNVTNPGPRHPRSRPVMTSYQDHSEWIPERLSVGKRIKKHRWVHLAPPYFLKRGFAFPFFLTLTCSGASIEYLGAKLERDTTGHRHMLPVTRFTPCSNTGCFGFIPSNFHLSQFDSTREIHPEEILGFEVLCKRYLNNGGNWGSFDLDF